MLIPRSNSALFHKLLSAPERVSGTDRGVREPATHTGLFIINGGRNSYPAQRWDVPFWGAPPSVAFCRMGVLVTASAAACRYDSARRCSSCTLLAGQIGLGKRSCTIVYKSVLVTFSCI